MGMNQIINMIIRMIMSRVIKTGINAGMNKMTRSRKGGQNPLYQDHDPMLDGSGVRNAQPQPQAIPQSRQAQIDAHKAAKRAAKLARQGATDRQN